MHAQIPTMQKSGPAVMSDRAEMSPRGTGDGLKFHGMSEFADPAISATAKRFSTLRARLALAGWTLAETVADGGAAYTAGRWGMSRTLADLEAVEAFAEQIGAPA